MRPTPILPPPVAPRKTAAAQLAAEPARLRLCLRRGDVPGGLGRGRLLRVEGLARPARLREPRQVRAAGHDAHPRARRQPDGRVRPRAAHLRADQRRAQAGDRRLPVGRGQALLRARRPRLHRHRPRGASTTCRTTARSAPRAPRPSPSRWPRTSCCRASRSSTASSRRRSSPSASSAPTPRTRSSSSISTRSTSAWAPTAWPPRRSTTSARS